MEQKYTNIHQSLIDQCKKGDKLAQGKLYQLYAKSMYNVALRITNDKGDAEDVLQDAFFNAFRRLGAYRGTATFGAWLKRIVVNKAIDCVRCRRQDAPLSLSEESIPIDTSSEVIDNDLEIGRVQEAVRQLPDGYRMVFSLYLMEGYDHEEISQILGISVSTSKSQLNRSKNKVRELLKQVKHGK